jgi:hypothetical protein
LKKRSKKLLRICAYLAGRANLNPKVFWFFFSKKNPFLPAPPSSPHTDTTPVPHTANTPAA